MIFIVNVKAVNQHNKWLTEAASAIENPPPLNSITPQASFDWTRFQFNKDGLGYGPKGFDGIIKSKITTRIAAVASLGLMLKWKKMKENERKWRKMKWKGENKINYNWTVINNNHIKNAMINWMK